MTITRPSFVIFAGYQDGGEEVYCRSCEQTTHHSHPVWTNTAGETETAESCDVCGAERHPFCGCDGPEPARLGCHVHGPQPREHAVPCLYCKRPTFNVRGRCDRCLETRS